MKSAIRAAIVFVLMGSAPSFAMEGEGIHPDDFMLFSYNGRTLFVDDRPVLHTIARLEGLGNYDTIYGGSRLKPPKPITTMTIEEVLAFQDRMVAAGSISSAVGNYQFIRASLRDTARMAKIPLSERFDRYTQDRLARNVLQRCGLYRHDVPDDTIANCLARSWAALPVASGEKAGFSYYKGTAGNKHLTTVRVILGTIRGRFKDARHAHALRPQAQPSGPVMALAPTGGGQAHLVQTTSPETGEIVFSVTKPGETPVQAVAAIRQSLLSRDEAMRGGFYSIPTQRVTVR